VGLNNARKIHDFPIPFPLAQMVTFMLVCHWAFTIYFCALLVNNVWDSVVISFMVVFSFWCINFIALELENPFGSDANDLPLEEMQSDFNDSLVELLNPKFMMPPKFDYSEEIHAHCQRVTVDVETHIDDLISTHGKNNKHHPRATNFGEDAEKKEKDKKTASKANPNDADKPPQDDTTTKVQGKSAQKEVVVTDPGPPAEPPVQIIPKETPKEQFAQNLPLAQNQPQPSRSAEPIPAPTISSQPAPSSLSTAPPPPASAVMKAPPPIPPAGVAPANEIRQNFPVLNPGADRPRTQIVTTADNILARALSGSFNGHSVYARDLKVNGPDSPLALSVDQIMLPCDRFPNTKGSSNMVDLI
jgi:hypothetical protein